MRIPGMRWIRRGALALLILLFIAAIAGVLVVQSDWFYEKVRRQMIFEVERATGGKVEIASFRFDWKSMVAEVRPFVLRGTEPPGAAPFFRTESLKVGLRIVSILKKDIDLEFATLERPSINILVRPDGSTNIPSPKTPRRTRTNPLELFVKLAIHKFEMNNGELTYSDRKIPLGLRGENLRLQLAYDFLNPRYVGDMTMARLNVTPGPLGELPFDFAGRLAIEKERIVFEKVTLGMERTALEARGTLTDARAPVLEFDVNGHLWMDELGKPLRLPVERTGSVAVEGKIRFGSGVPFSLDGRMKGSGLAVSLAGMRIPAIALNSVLHVDTDKIDLTNLDVAALGGSFRGAARIEELESYRVSGTLGGMALQQLSRYPGVKSVVWNATASGPVIVTGSFRRAKDLSLRARLDIAPAPGPRPLSGLIELDYDGRSEKLKLGESNLATANTQMRFTGTLGETLKVSIRSRNLDDALPVFALFSEEPPPRIPLTIKSGLATFDGVVAGPMRSPQATGRATVTGFEIEGRTFDSFAADLSINESSANLTNIALLQGPLRLDGQLQLALANWKPADDGPVSGGVTIRNAQLSRLLAEAKTGAPVEGLLSGTIEITGTVKAPSAIAKLTIDKVSAYGERFDRVRADLKYTGGSIELVSGNVEIGPARLRLTGAYNHPPDDWTSGDLRFAITGENVTLAQIQRIKQYASNVEGQVALDLQGTARIERKSVRVRSLIGVAAVRGLAVDGRPVGDVGVNAATTGEMLNIKAKVDFRGTSITGESEVRLAGDYPAQGQIQISRLSFSTLNDLRTPGKVDTPLPFDGFLEGNVTFSGPLAQLDNLKGRIEIANLEIRPNVRERLGVPQDRLKTLALRNSGPIVINIDGSGLQVESATLVGPETSLQAAGRFSFASKTPWDLQVKGFVNLATLQTFNPDFLASGVSTVNASIRGSLEQPQVNGKLELKNAAFSLPDFPNGLDQANGEIVFDRNRATIQSLTAQTGGGELSASGFVGFGGPEMIYRLQATANRVRVRYPEGVSTTLNANLSFTGTSTDSLLSGQVTIIRLGFNPRTDLGGLLAESAKPIATPHLPNPFLRGMQFDVRVETAPNVEFQTTLTRDIQAETDLRLRGSLARPILQGRISITQGEIQFFGNRYTINRGEIGFFNPVKIQPVLDMDLETRVRGVTVNINFSGPINKLNVTYRSDPPLQSQEIIALLAVGRAPAGAPLPGAGQTVENTSFLQTGANTLLGQAIASPVSSRLQRFFGVSRLKIDPQLTGTDNTPQARLTIEQQISRDVTITYVTNLTRTNQQLVQIQWDINRNWSVIALREENGIFGVDFQYRRQF